MVKFRYDDIESAFYYVSSAGYGMNSAYLDVTTGKIFYRSELTGSDELDDEDRGADPLIAVPHKYDLDLGQSIVFEFVEDNLPDAYEEVRYLFRKRGAYSRYREMLSSRGMLEAWYRFEQIAWRRSFGPGASITRCRWRIRHEKSPFDLFRVMGVMPRRDGLPF